MSIPKTPLFLLLALILAASLTSAFVGQGPVAVADENHQRLRQWRGTWEIEVWQIDYESGKKPRKGKPDYGSSFTAQLACEGVWLVMDFQTDPKSWDYQAHCVFGYSKGEESYLAQWFDSTSTRITTFKGNLGGDGKEYRLEGQAPDVDDPSNLAAYALSVKFEGDKSATLELKRKDASGTPQLLYVGDMTRKKK